MFSGGTKQKGFTLLELISVVVILAILSAIAIPRYYSYKETAQLSALKATLGNVRTAVHNFYLNTAVTEDEPRYPTHVELTTIGVVMSSDFPENPYSERDGVRHSNGVAASTVSDANNFGWAYKQSTGEFWANTEIEQANTY